MGLPGIFLIGLMGYGQRANMGMGGGPSGKGIRDADRHKIRREK